MKMLVKKIVIPLIFRRQLEMCIDPTFVIIEPRPKSSGSGSNTPKELQHHNKGLTNINNKDDKCFLWCHVRHLNPQETNPQRIKRTDKELAEQLNYEGIEFPVKAKHYNKIEVQNQIKINVFGYENKQFYPIYKSKNAEYEDEMNLLLIANGETNHYVYIQDFKRMMYNKTKNKNKKHFCMSCLLFGTEILFSVTLFGRVGTRP